jgi:hypothetical protein
VRLTDPVLAVVLASMEAKHRSSSSDAASSNSTSGEVAVAAPATASVDTKAYRFLDGGGKLFEVLVVTCVLVREGGSEGEMGREVRVLRLFCS